jgi:CHAT domain
MSPSVAPVRRSGSIDTSSGAVPRRTGTSGASTRAFATADEALVFFLVGAKESHVFALTRQRFEWRTISLGEKNMAAKVAAFRRGLDVDELTKSVSTGQAQLFDLAAAHELYIALLGPVEALIKDKPELLIVPAGALTALPFHLLVTDKPAIAVPQMQINEMAAYRDASRTEARLVKSALIRMIGCACL